MLLKPLIRNEAAVSTPRAELIKCVCFDLPRDKREKSEMLSETTWGEPWWRWTCPTIVTLDIAKLSLRFSWIQTMLNSPVDLAGLRTRRKYTSGRKSPVGQSTILQPFICFLSLITMHSGSQASWILSQLYWGGGGAAAAGSNTKRTIAQ